MLSGSNKKVAGNCWVTANWNSRAPSWTVPESLAHAHIIFRVETVHVHQNRIKQLQDRFLQQLESAQHEKVCAVVFNLRNTKVQMKSSCDKMFRFGDYFRVSTMENFDPHQITSDTKNFHEELDRQKLLHERELDEQKQMHEKVFFECFSFPLNPSRSPLRYNATP